MSHPRHEAVAGPGPMTDPGRNLAVDLLKVVLAVMVVAIHADPLAPLGRVVELLSVDGLFRLAVPVFLVFNGWYMAPALAAGSGGGVVRRAAVLYATWMLIYAPIWAPIVAHYSVAQVLRFLILGYAHLWYLAGLAVAGAVMVAIRHWPTPAILGLALILHLVGTAMSALIAAGIWVPAALDDLGITPNRNGLLLAFPYLAIGVVLWRLDLPARLPQWVPVLVGCVGLGLLAAETLAMGALPVPVLHESLASLLIAVPAVAVMALQSRARITSRRLADHASGLFFLHMLVLALLRRNTDLGNVAKFVLTLAACVILTEALRRLRLVRDLF